MSFSLSSAGSMRSKRRTTMTKTTTNSEQPKDDNLGSREQQLIRKVKALKVETSVLQIDMDNRLSEFRRSVLNIMLELDEWAENKINDEDQR
jgi:hypothetical protein